MFRFGFRSKLIFGLAAASGVLLLSAALTFSILSRNIVDRQWVSHTLIVLEKLSELQSQVADAENRPTGISAHRRCRLPGSF